MVNKIQKNVNAAEQDCISQPGFGLKKETSGQSGLIGHDSDTVSVWKEKYFHLLAELENTKKCLVQAPAAEIEGKKMEWLKDVLPIADGLDLVLNHVAGEEDNLNIFQRIKGLKKIMDRFFIKYDVKTIDALGTVFNPNRHDALGMIRNAKAIAHTVVRIEKKGYLCQDKLLRPTKVMVAAD